MVVHGFSERQAEGLSQKRMELLSAQLANKADIAKIMDGMGTLRQETRVEIATLKSDLKRWMLGAFIA